MTNQAPLQAKLDRANQQLTKARQLNAVLEGCFDLLNGAIEDEHWHALMAELAGCDTVAAIWWRKGLPATYMARVHGQLTNPVSDWVNYLEPALAAAKPDNTSLLQAIEGSEQFLSADRMVYCLNHSPMRFVFIFTDRHGDRAWTDTDRDHLLQVMRIVEKSVHIKRRLSWLEDVLELTNKVMDEMPRGFFVLTPDGEVFASNRQAERLANTGEILRIQDGKLRLCDSRKNTELCAELEKILYTPHDKISDYVWHRNLSDSTAPGSAMVAMLAFPFDNWKLESTARDRVAVMVIQLIDELAVPAASQLSEFYKLTRSQCNVVVQLMEGCTIEQAAANLHISINTVRTHLRAIYAKLGVANKSQLLQRVSTTITGPKIH